MVNMLSKEPNSPFDKIAQIGIVSRSKEKVISSMRTIFGVEPTSCSTVKDDPGRRYYGQFEDFTAELVFYHFGNMELEFMIPTSGSNIWSDWLDAHGEGLHHFQFDVKSFDDAVEYMAHKGIGVMQEGHGTRNTALRWGYFDTEATLSYIVEINNVREVNGDN